MTSSKTASATIDQKTFPEIRYFVSRINRGVPFKKQPVYKMIMPDGKPEELAIEPSQKIANHSSEFNWGYGGSGPAQLAIALLLDATTDPEKAQKYSYDFKTLFVAGWGDTWSIGRTEILTWLEGVERAEMLERQSRN